MGSRDLVDEYYFNRVSKPYLGPILFHEEGVLVGETTF